MAGKTDAAATCAAARDVIWALECVIYGARGGGSLQPYLDALSDGYMAWPPHKDAPIGAEALRRQSEIMQTQPNETLEMSLVDFTLHGETAIIYYRTHRIVRPDGTPVDEYFDVIHVWVIEQGRWKIMGGMARRAATEAGPAA